MAAPERQPHTYVQGHSGHTTATHERRTAESDSGFLLPHIKPTDQILDVGCGPGTITTSFAKYASEGAIVGVDISSAVLQKARMMAEQTGVSHEGPGSVTFEHGNVLDGLTYADDTFDIVFSSQLLGHLMPLDVAVKALVEMRRVLKPGGILASRDAADSHFYPKSLDLDRLWTDNLARVIGKGAPLTDRVGTNMPALLRRAGFDADGGKVQVGAGTTVFASPAARSFLAGRAAGQLKEGDAFRQSWLGAGIGEGEIEETVRAAKAWAATENAWFAALQTEMLAWK